MYCLLERNVSIQKTLGAVASQNASIVTFSVQTRREGPSNENKSLRKWCILLLNEKVLIEISVQSVTVDY